MAKKQTSTNPELVRQEIVTLFQKFEILLTAGELRAKVLYLVGAFKKVRLLGLSIVPNTGENLTSARDRILVYFQTYQGKIISGDELMVVSGIQDYPRRIRELRVQFGWQIVSGEAIKEMLEEGDLFVEGETSIKPDSYALLNGEQDRESAHRWYVANEIRKDRSLGAKDRILQFLRQNAGKQVAGDELRYVAGNATEWARRVRELRTEQAWPIYTRNSGRPDLAVGVYILEEDRQGAEHDRKIPDPVRIKVLNRDAFKCRRCQWSRGQAITGDPRKSLELHHVKAHLHKGENTEENLITLCNVCHDEIHKVDKQNQWVKAQVEQWLAGF